MDSGIVGVECREIPRGQLFLRMLASEGTDINKKLNDMEKYLLMFGPFSPKDTTIFRRDMVRLKGLMKTKWIDSHRKKEVFEKKNKEWLDGTIKIPKLLSPSSIGRPVKLFSESCERTKRRKTDNLRKHTDLDVLTFAVQTKFCEEGKRDASVVLKEITSTPNRATKYKKAFVSSSQSNKKVQLTPQQALSMFIEADLSRRQYEIIRSFAPHIYPCYSKLQEAKKECYPDKNSYRVTETLAEIGIQSLMDHTASRLLQDLKEIMLTLEEEERSSFVMICKWGCDGAQQAQYKQKFENDSNSDSNLFQSSFVPLRLICSNNNRIIWQNPTPSSPRYCRPIRMRFIKETTDVTKEEIDYVTSAVKDLEKTIVQITDNVTCAVSHTMMLTMIDGKVCNAATSTSSTMRCYICGLTSKDFNSLDKKGTVNPEALKFGLSVLHARIRFFEAVLHLSYKLPLQKWQLRTQEEKEKAKEKKLEIQGEFRTKMGLIVDVPKANFGNTNDGNTSRRFFADHELSAEITGIDSNFIYRLKVILEVLSSGHEIDTKKFSIYAKETANLYVNLYSWHPMTPTLHKILMHGPEVIEKALLPIGQLSEEAQEARNKHIRLYRQNFARKFSRKDCNMDILQRLLLNSDPVMTGMKIQRSKTSEPFMKEAISMLKSFEPNDAAVSHNFLSDDEE